MTVSSTTRSVTYLGDGASTGFTVPFRFDANGDLQLTTLDPTGLIIPLVLDRDYTLAGATSATGGTATLAVAVASATTLIITRVVARTQLDVYTPFGPFPAQTTEAALDKLTMIVQEDADNLARAVSVPENELGFVLPPIAQRTGYAGWVGGVLSSVLLPSGLTAQQTITVPDRATLAALASPVVGQVVFLAEAGREGFFKTFPGIPNGSDLFQGLYVQSTVGSFYYARLWDQKNGQPEWWGAATGITTFDNRPYFASCLALCPTMQLQGATYWVQGRWLVSTSHRRIVGVGRYGEDPSFPDTRVCLASSTEDVFMIGLDVDPGTINDYVSVVDVEYVTFVSAASPTPPATGIQGGPSCFKMQYALNCRATNVAVIDGTNGFYLTGAVFCHVRDCLTQRLTAGTTPTNDYYIGVMLDQSLNIPANTGDASTYIDNVNVTGTTNCAINYAVYTADGCTDMFVNNVETSGVDVGVSLNGSPRRVYGSEDCKVTNCTFDQVVNGITLYAASNTAAIRLHDNYVALRSTSGATAISIASSPLTGKGGAVSILGNQLGGSGGNTYGIVVTASAGIVSVGNILLDLANPVVMTNSFGCRFLDQIVNPTQSAAAAFTLTNSSRTIIDSSVNGMAGAFAKGVALVGSTNSVIEVRSTGIDQGAVSGNRVDNNGTAVTTPGPFGSHLLQGL